MQVEVVKDLMAGQEFTSNKYKRDSLSPGTLVSPVIVKYAACQGDS